MDYDELVDDIVKQVHARYDDYVEYRKSNGLVVDSFDEFIPGETQKSLERLLSFSSGFIIRD